MLVVVAIVARQRWRRLGVVVLAAGAGAALFALLDTLVRCRRFRAPARSPTAPGWHRPTSRRWSTSRAPAAVVTAGKPVVAPFLAAVRRPEPAGARRRVGRRRDRRGPGAAGGRRRGRDRRRRRPGRARRTEPPADPERGRATRCARGGLAVDDLALERADGGRAQLYTAALVGGDRAFVKVYARDSRDADLLYRGYRTALLRGPNDDWPAMTLEQDVEHEALLLLMAQRADVSCPALRSLCALDDGSMALAVEYVEGRPLDALPADEIDAGLLDRVWQQVSATARRAPRAPLAARREHPGDRGRARRDRPRIRHRVGGSSGPRRSTAPSSLSPSPSSSGPSPSLASAVAHDRRATRSPAPRRTCNPSPCRPRPASRRPRRCCASSATGSPPRPVKRRPRWSSWSGSGPEPWS